MSGLWTFRRKNPEQTLDSVLSAIPTAAVQVVAASTTLDLLRNSNNNNNFGSSSSASPEITLATTTANQLKSALQETESNENAIDPEWATLRNKWLNEEFHAAQSSSGLQQQKQQQKAATIFSQDDGDEDEFSREYRQYETRLKQEDVAAKQWLYQVSPEKKSPSAASPNPNATSSMLNNNKIHNNNLQEDTLYYHGVENRAKSLSLSSYDDRRGKSSSYSPAHQIQGDIVDYRSLLARVERQVMATEIEGNEKSVIPPAKERQFVLHTSSRTSSYITATPVMEMQNVSTNQAEQSALRRNLNNSRLQEQQQLHLQRSVTKNKATTAAAALVRANRSLARTDANLDQIVRSQHEIEQKKETVVRVASLMEMKKSSSSSSIMGTRSSSTVSRAPVRSVVSAKLNFPTTTAISTSRESTTNEISSNKASIDETLKRSQQISRSASSALKTVHEQQKPSARTALHKTVSSKFADPNSNEFKTKLNRDLEIMEEENNKKIMTVAPPPPTTRSAVVQSKTTTRSSSTSVGLLPKTATISDPFVQRMVQRTKERDEARKNLLQKYQEEKDAKIQREIQEAEEDAERTLAERTKAAKLREKMQRRMREDQERKDQLVHLDEAREQMGEVLCKRHYLGRVGFYPWRRFVQEKKRIADLLRDHQLVRASFARLKRNVVFERKLRQTVLVTRCVGLTRLLKRWTMRFVLMKLRRNVLDSKRDVRDAKNQHLRNCLRRWKQKALKHQAVSMVRKDQWCEEQCVEAETFRKKMQLRKTFRKWSIKLQEKKDDEERQKIRSKMWSIAMSALTD